MALLEIENLEVNYGMIKALKGVSFEVNKGEIIALIGANGAGKTTTLHAISGILPSTSGKIIYNGQNITKTPAHKIVKLGISQEPEGRRVFSQLSVFENLLMGAYTRRDKSEINEDLEKIYERFPRLEERKNQIAGTLSGGEQQMLAIARALMSRPRLLLLDEPSLGLAPIVVKQIFQTLRELARNGMTIFLVEQNAHHALKLSDRGYVMVNGQIRLSGSGEELLGNQEVRKAYLGGV